MYWLGVVLEARHQIKVAFRLLQNQVALFKIHVSASKMIG